jgi:hypothetical protein
VWITSTVRPAADFARNAAMAMRIGAMELRH